jgi:hypothetical protein
MGDVRNAYEILVGKTRRDHLEDTVLRGRHILSCILEKWDLSGLDSSGSGQGSVGGRCEHGDES